MKAFIAVSENNGVESKIDSRFGRGNYFITYDMDNDSIIEIEENKFKEEGHGVGIKTAGIAVEKGCTLAIGAQPGPKAEQVFTEGKVEIFVVTVGTVKDAVRKYREK
ncbi:MAG: NifB/NifX family molybdenum-iron cluster-binding protein [Acidobacteriota bacterium]